MQKIIFMIVILSEQDIALSTIPYTSPIFIGPAKTERKIRPATLQHFIERPLQDSTTIEPVVVVAEAMNAIFSG